MSDFCQELIGVLGKDCVRKEEPMRNHTTFRIGGPVQFFVTPENTKDLTRGIHLCQKAGKSYFILGRGSNLLVSDTGWRGVVISMEHLSKSCVQGTSIVAGAGAPLSRLAREAREAGLTGLEFAAGIPGTLGGALVMNAGAYGSEMKDVLAVATVLAPDGKIHRKDKKELELGYRTSSIIKNGYVVLEAELNLKEGDKNAIGQRMEDLAFQRKSKQPLEYPSAGSTFKRPKGHFAGKLIDDAGLRGFSVGQAQVSEKHCGFVINKGGATAEDVMKLREEVRRRVKEHSGVELEPEIKKLGL